MVLTAILFEEMAEYDYTDARFSIISIISMSMMHKRKPVEIKAVYLIQSIIAPWYAPTFY